MKTSYTDISRNWRILLQHGFFTLLAATPFVALFIFATLPLLSEKVAASKKQNTRTAVESVFNILKYYDQQVQNKKLSMDQAMLNAKKEIEQLRYSGSEYFWINDTKPIMIMHPTKPELNGKDISEMKDPNGKKLFIEMIQVSKASSEGGFVDYMWPKPGREAPQDKISFVRLFEPWGWIVGSGVYMDDVHEAIQQIKKDAWAEFAIVTIISIFISFISVWRQLQKVVIPVQNTTGNLEKDSRDLSQAANHLATTAHRIEKAANTQASAVDQTSSTIVEINAMIEKTKEQAQQSQQTASELKVSAQEGFTSIKKLSDLLLSIHDFSKTASHDISQNLSQLSEINKTISEIQEKTKSIDEIVFQTRLLSFNASVEAARAGESGKGFSVVAEEIGKLAHLSGQSAKEIADIIEKSAQVASNISKGIRTNTERLIDEISARVSQGNEFAQQCNQVLQNVLDNAKHAETKSNAIMLSTEEIMLGSREISGAMSNIDGATRENLDSVRLTASHSQEILRQSQHLESLVTDLKNVA